LRQPINVDLLTDDTPTHDIPNLVYDPAPIRLVSGDVLAAHPIDTRTGRPVAPEDTKDQYQVRNFDDDLIIPDRINAMYTDLFNRSSAPAADLVQARKQRWPTASNKIAR